MATLRLILGDQLSQSVATLRDLDPERDTILIAEVAAEATYVPHHQQKLTLCFSAMRHFAAELSARGLRVRYTRLDDPDNAGSLAAELARAIVELRPDRIVVTEPGEWRLALEMEGWSAQLALPVERREDDRFLCSRDTFERWARGRKELRMEFFYRLMRRQTGWLMAGDDPEGGQFNFDAENRKALPRALALPYRTRFAPDAMTLEVIDLVRTRFHANMGDARDFDWPVTRAQALDALDHFIADCLPRFGDYQDAMRTGEAWLHHSLLSTSLNLGLLLPREVCEAALAAYAAGRIPLAATEGFIRQILGWREFVRGIYWLEGPDYDRSNALSANRPLPALYWTGETDMRCMADAIATTKRHAYAHHIQRLMVTGNFALPNVHGMVPFADGGRMTSKPYAASGAYIDRMSDSCKGCRYKVAAKSGPDACPLGPLYWHFLMRNRERLAGNPRLGMPFATLAKMTEERRAELRTDAEAFLAKLDRGERV
jgi:deoxyribodipyrimidine photolyase-related protein